MCSKIIVVILCTTEILFFNPTFVVILDMVVRMNGWPVIFRNLAGLVQTKFVYVASSFKEFNDRILMIIEMHNKRPFTYVTPEAICRCQSV